MAPPSTGGPAEGAAEDWDGRRVRVRGGGAGRAVRGLPEPQHLDARPGRGGLPVMVWIQGGMFELSSTAAYDGSRFARDGVVCVVINWRPGAEGFLYLGDGIANLGLLDQVAALQWVRENIAAFGGDPGNVTVFGESAGAMSIGTLLAMPRAEGLFRRAILQSGAAHQVMPADDALRIAGYLADKLGVPATREAIARRRGRSGCWRRRRELKAELLADPDPDRWGAAVVASVMPWQPVIDGDVLPGAADRPDRRRVRQRRSTSSSARTPTTGGCGWSSAAPSARITDEILDRTGPRLRLPVHGRIRARPAETALAAYRARYPDGDARAICWRRSRPTGGCGCRPSAWPTRTPTPRPRRHLHVRVRLALTGPRRGPRPRDSVRLRHRSTDAPLFGPLLGTDPPQELARTMHAAWVAFACTGDPGWPRYDPARRATMRFDTASRVVDDPRSWERALWKGIR